MAATDIEYTVALGRPSNRESGFLPIEFASYWAGSNRGWVLGQGKQRQAGLASFRAEGCHENWVRSAISMCKTPVLRRVEQCIGFVWLVSASRRARAVAGERRKRLPAGFATSKRDAVRDRLFLGSWEMEEIGFVSAFSGGLHSCSAAESSTSGSFGFLSVVEHARTAVGEGRKRFPVGFVPVPRVKDAGRGEKKDSG
jgi:hypothetical protein